ncbi:hypothetical protein [Paenibacillus sp. 1011MAR3C5]|uniref:hypothetical protein n=1 Tax=Paenibacillus sp. 1011MAR3C5 TaxID=1675787 RepID=UPI001603A9AD|nr:hypothetical protein [Paenibacillus sp. 1011MAR3C5]
MKSNESYHIHKADCGSGKTYSGEVKNGARHGYGVMEGLGYEIKGFWKDDMLHGKCSVKMPDGYVFKGSYVNDKRHGVGTEFYPNGRAIMATWRHDVMLPNWRIKQPDGSEITLKVNDVLDVVGAVTIKYCDGSVYKGDAIIVNAGTPSWNVVRKGYGSLKYPDRTVIEGYWLHDEYINELIIDGTLIS